MPHACTQPYGSASPTPSTWTTIGPASARRLLLEVFRQREDDSPRFTTDLRTPPASNHAERDLRPSKIQENISGRLTNIDRAKDRYLIRRVLSTSVKAVKPLSVLKPGPEFRS